MLSDKHNVRNDITIASVCKKWNERTMLLHAWSSDEHFVHGILLTTPEGICCNGKEQVLKEETWHFWIPLYGATKSLSMVGLKLQVENAMSFHLQQVKN
jgi:hypothetical protein